MGLLDKFAEIEVKNDERISKIDKRFCEVQQESYDATRQTFDELRTFWKAAVEIQEEILFDLPDDHKCSNGFLDIMKNLSVKDINEAIEDTQARFIERLVNYFRTTYSVSLDESVIKAHLLPEEPKGGRWNSNTEEWMEYHSQMRNLSLRYEQVLDEIFIQLGGRSFADRAVDEIKEKCHNAAWNKYRQKAEYEVKKDVVRFTSYACKYTDWYSSGSWELNDGMKPIMYGLAHFETGSLHLLPHGFSNLVGWSRLNDPLIEFSTCEKVVQLRMFKNSRVDIKFASALLAKQFTEEYLGLVC